MHTGQGNIEPGKAGSPARPGDAIAELRPRVEQRLRDDGLAGALALLNDRTRCRFTGLYRVAPPDLLNVALHDRENPTFNISGAVCALSDTFCSIVSERGRPFRVSDAPADPQLQAHPARDSVQSYAGVPVRLPDGRLVGTLCHFDGRPRILPLRELAVMEELAPLFAPWLDAPSGVAGPSLS